MNVRILILISTAPLARRVPMQSPNALRAFVGSDVIEIQQLRGKIAAAGARFSDRTNQTLIAPT